MAVTEHIGTLVRLRWALTTNSWRRSTSTMIFSVLGALYLLGVAVGVSMGLLMGLPDMGPDPLRGTIGLLVASVIVLGWTVLPPLFTGVDATLDPVRFAVYPMRRSSLVAGLLAGTLTTPLGALTLVVMLALGASWWDRPALLAVSLPAALVATVTAVALCYGTAGLLAAVTGRRRVRELISILVLVPLMFSGFAFAQLLESLDELLALGVSVAQVLAWTPFGAAFAAVDAAAAGAPARAVLFAVLALAWCAAALGLWALAIRRVVEPAPTRGGGSARARRGDTAAQDRPLRVFGRPATGPTTAVAARALVYWLKDPRYSGSLLVLPAFAVLLLWMGSTWEGEGIAAWALYLLAPLVAWTLGFAISADIAYDYTAFHLHVLSGMDGIHDRAGRALALGLWALPLVVVTAVVGVAVPGTWHHLPALLGFSVGTFLTMLGLASFVSARFIYPVPKPGDSPLATPQGAMMRIMLVQLATIAASVLVCLPLLVMAGVYVFGQGPVLGWALLAVGLGWGALALWLGIRWGGAWYDRAQADTFQAVKGW